MSDTAALQVVPATAEHLDMLAPLFDGYRQFYGQASDVAAARAFLAERLARDESAVFLALDGARAVGFAQLYPSFSSVSLRPIWILNDLYVAPEARQQGAATALVHCAERFGRQVGAARLVLATAHDNAPARSLYEKLGWQRDEAFAHYDFPLE